MNKRIRFLTAVCIPLFLLLSAVCAEEFVSANDLAPADLSAPLKIDDTFTITASADKGTSIQKCDPATASDGEIFNQRIKLGGTGNDSYRSIVFKAAANAKVTVYLKSSSKTDARILRVVSMADGSEIGTVTAIPDDLKTAGMGTVTIPAAGIYYLTSKSGGIYVFAVSVE